MRKLVFVLMLTTIALLTTRCTLGNKHTRNEEIFKLLNSNQPTDLIFGAFDAGESKDTVFLPLLLKNAMTLECVPTFGLKVLVYIKKKWEPLKKY